MSLYENILDFVRNKSNNNQTEAPQIQAVTQAMPAPSLNSMQYPLPIQNQANNEQDSGVLWNNIKKNINLFDKYENPTNETNSATTDENGNTTLNGTIGTPVITQRGFLNDFARGANENYNNRFALKNWQDNENKGIGYRLGEGLGTAGRILNSPLGRGLAVAGLAALSGEGGLNSLGYGLQTAALNQQNVLNNDLYRQSLIRDYGYTPDLLNGVKGYINKDTYSSLANNTYKMQKLQQQQVLAQMKDNTSRARMIGIWLKNGDITPQTAENMISNYGITDAEFQESNDTRKTNSTIELNKTKADVLKNPPVKKSVVVHKSSGNKGGNNGGKNKPIGTTVNNPPAKLIY